MSCENVTVITSGQRILMRDSTANEETRLEAFGTKGMRKILRVSWTAEKTNELVLNKAGVNSELLDTVKARKLAYYGHTMRKQGKQCKEQCQVHAGEEDHAWPG